MKILVVAPHPDDEILGAGGTIARMAKEGHEITVAIVTKGWEPLFPESQVEQVRAEAQEANSFLGVKAVRFLDLPVTRINEIPLYQLNGLFDQLMDQEQPRMVFLPFYGDRHEDHRRIFESCMVALRPVDRRKHVERVLCYETVSETHWSTPYVEPHFQPNLHIDISEYLERKIGAMRRYMSQVRPMPDARSLEALKSLATWRGSTVGREAAEAFVSVRECW